ncbi:MAG: hypothetical protein QN716_10215, partial [Nitrososphaeraceae archaeon]|nr:hypothetical protein [Nitrososphaeraceae archaeon]
MDTHDKERASQVNLTMIMKKTENNVPFLLLLLCSLIGTACLLSTSDQINIHTAQAHLEHLPHYNAGESRIGYGDYMSFMALDPDYGTIDYPTKITFSIQDFDGKDVYNVSTMVEIYDSVTGKRVHVFPWTFRDVGDFDLYYQFPKKRGYQIVLSIANAGEKSSLYSSSIVEPSRSILNDISDCICTRTVFNISIATTFGTIQNSLFFICIISPLALLGIILTKNYYKKYGRVKGRNYNVSLGICRENEKGKIEGFGEGRKQIIKYSLTLLALAGGIVHLVVFPEHGSLHVYYSIFLLAAAGGQIAYGVLYFLVMLSKPFYEMPIEDLQVIKSTYQHNMAVNLFGFMGTAVLIGLYVYVVIYPPPLSPINQPEEIE